MPIRQLPRTNQQRLAAMQTVQDRLEGPLPFGHPFREATVLELTHLLPVYAALVKAQREAQSLQIGATLPLIRLRRLARVWVTQGYASIVSAIVRGTFKPAVLNLYGRPLHAKGAPRMKSDADILASAAWLEEGETARVAGGGQPIAFPSVVEIMEHANAFKEANLLQGTLKTDNADAQKAVATTNVEVDRLILRLWNEIETAYNVGNAPSMRRKSREWGVVYVQGRVEPPSAETNAAWGLVKDAITGKPMRLVRVQVEGLATRIRTNANGRYSLPLLEPGQYVVRFTHKGYEDEERTIDVVEDEMVQMDIRMTPKTTE